MAAIPYFLIYLTPIVAAIGWWLGGVGLFATPLYLFVAIPIADLLAGHDTHNPDDADARGNNPLFNLALRGWVPVQMLMLVGVLAWVGGGSATAVELGAAILALGLMNTSIGINVAHELMHRKSKGDRALAEGLMASVSYTHFCVEHVSGHHRNVGTPADPATARLGESVYTFLPRTLWGGVKSAWHLESARTARRKIPAYSWANRRLRYPLFLAMAYVGVALLSGPVGVFVFAAQGAVAFCLLEVINYVEHYGLAREQLPNGRYESVQPHHSWNSDFRLTNWFLFNLQRHADHHAHASRPYWSLRHFPEGPQLPLSYASMVLIALVPPLWRAVMDRRVWIERRRLMSAAA